MGEAPLSLSLVFSSCEPDKTFFLSVYCRLSHFYFQALMAVFSKCVILQSSQMVQAHLC